MSSQECFRIPDVPYSEFSKKIHKMVFQKRIPIAGVFELTNRCTYQCEHCYLDTDIGSDSGELTTDEVLNIIDELVEMECLWLLFTGGDPLIRDDFKEIYLYAKRKGLLLSVFINCLRLNKELILVFKEWKPFSIEITLYGITEKSFENITKTKGSFNATMNGIELLLENGITLELKTLVTTSNKHELWEIRKFAERKNLPFRFDPIINPKLNGSHDNCKLRLLPSEIIKLDELDSDRKKSWEDSFSAPLSGLKDDLLYQCGAGLITFSINAHGFLNMCGMSKDANFDLRKGSFKRGWDSFISLREKKYSKDFLCRNCNMIVLCGQCPALAELENGNPETRIEYFCELAHLRAKTFGGKDYQLY